jgi:hypothetical protein
MFGHDHEAGEDRAEEHQLAARGTRGGGSLLS